MITLSCKLELSSQDKEKLLDLMRRFSSAVRSAYNRLLENKSQSQIQKLLQETFSLNARYSASAYFKAQAILNSCKERGQNPKKLVFGGRKLFERLSKNHLKGQVKQDLFQSGRSLRVMSINALEIFEHSDLITTIYGLATKVKTNYSNL